MVIKSRRLRWIGYFTRMEEGPTGEKLLRRPTRRLDDNIRMNLNEICVNTWNLIDSALDRDYWRALENAVLSLRVP